jgi:lysophospholipase L1-like esterase
VKGAPDARRRPSEAGLTLLAFVLPASLPIVRLAAAASEGARVSSGTLLVALIAGAWAVAAVAAPPIRRFLLDLGTWLVARLPFPFFVVAALLLGSFVSTIALAPGLAAAALACGGLALAGMRRTWRDERNGRRRFAGMVALLVVNGAILVALDAATRRFLLPRSSHNDLFLVHDPWVGWKLRPSWSIDRRIVAHDYVAHESSNRLGFRGPEYPVARTPGKRRIVVLGDSHTEGYCVNDGETWPERLEAELASRRPSEVLSFAVAGWSTDQEYLAWLHYARPFQPDVVLLQFCPNDPAYTTTDHYWRGHKPCFSRFGDQLVLEGVPVPDERLSFTHGTALSRSAIALLLEVSLSQMAIAEQVATFADVDEQWLRTRLLLRALAHAVAADGARFAVFDAEPDDRVPDARLRAICAAESIDFLDVDPAFGGDYAGHRARNDRHMNKKGHAAVARTLAPLVLPFLEPAGDAR